MKKNMKLLVAVAILATACSTGSMITSKNYTDDLYYIPGDVQPVREKAVKTANQPEEKSTIAVEIKESEQGKMVNNYVVPKSSRKDKNAYYFEDEPAYTDTILEYENNNATYTINNYFEGEEMSYASRIRAFYNPYYYDPFWDPFWDPYWGSGWGMGFGYGGGYNHWYPGMGYGFGGGYYPGWGMSYYSGWGGYNPYWGGGWYDPWYSGWGSGYGYGFSGGYAWGGNFDDGRKHVTGAQNYTGLGGSSYVKYGMNNKNLNYNNAGNITGRSGPDGSTRLSNDRINTINTSGRNPETELTGGTSTRNSGTREAVSNQARVNQNIQSGTRQTRGEVLLNLKRAPGSIGNSGNVQQNRTSTTTTVKGQVYTPTYSRPRMNTQPSYNSGSTRQYTQPSSVTSGSSTRYTRPQEGSYKSSVTTGSSQSGSYNRSSSTERNSNVSSTPSRSTESYSPSRTYSAPASSGTISSGSSDGGSRGSSSGGRTR